MELPSFSVTWDYLCPFARNAHEHLVSALEAGAPWDVTFAPFSLMQAHVTDGEPPVWDQKEKARGVLALEAGIVVRDRFPDRFLAAHRALFAARHDEGKELANRDVVEQVLSAVGVPASEVMAEIDKGWPLDQLRTAHDKVVAEHAVFGVPTFIVDDQAVFVRIMTRPEGDAARARSAVEGIVSLIATRPELNEFKHTTIPR
jgi:protein-disulfide isomerase-like protein with CxxC motif